MLHHLAYLASSVPIPQPQNNSGWIWFVAGLIIGLILRGKF